jgi:hypothetical protein
MCLIIKNLYANYKVKQAQLLTYIIGGNDMTQMLPKEMWGEDCRWSWDCVWRSLQIPIDPKITNYVSDKYNILIFVPYSSPPF